MSRLFWTPEREAAFAEAWRANRSLASLAREFQISRGAVCHHAVKLRERGVPLAIRSTSRGPQARIARCVGTRRGRCGWPLYDPAQVARGRCDDCAREMGAA